MSWSTGTPSARCTRMLPGTTCMVNTELKSRGSPMRPERATSSAGVR